MLDGLKSFAGAVRDHGLSFAVGAVPAFFGTAFMATCYSLAYGIGSAIGLSTGLAVAAGVVGTVVSAGLSIGVGALIGVGGFLGVAALASSFPFLRDAKIRTPGVVAGVATGLAASIALAFNLTASDPQEQAPISDPGPVTLREMQEDHGVLAPLFTDAGSGAVRAEIVMPAANAGPVPAPRLAA